MAKSSSSSRPRPSAVGSMARMVYCEGLLVVALCVGWIPLRAARVSEPPTVLYGQVVFRSAGHQLIINEGMLELTLRGSLPSAWERRFRTRLESLGGGIFSYRLSLPHDLLAYDLEAADNVVPIAAGPSQLEQVSVTLDGLPLTIVDPGVKMFTVHQTERAATRRVDWDASQVLADIDRDGLPDVWEDRHGYDRWNPMDGAAFFGPGGGGSNSQGSGSDSQTFAQWRTVHFPADHRDLEVFGSDDADGDGISNLVEYAFGLNPTDPSDLSGMDRLPRGRYLEGRFNVTFERYAPETEIEYRVEVSGDLINWQPSSTLLSEPAAAAGSVSTSRSALLSERLDAPECESRFVRMQIVRRR